MNQPKANLRFGPTALKYSATGGWRRQLKHPRGVNVLRLTIIVATLIVGGCATAGRDIVFTAEAETAFVVLAIEGLPPDDAVSQTFEFTEVDLAGSRFGDDAFQLEFDPNGRAELTRSDARLASTAPVRIAWREVPAGEYALTLLNVCRDDVPLASRQPIRLNLSRDVITCFHDSALTYRLQPGRVNVLPGIRAATLDEDGEIIEQADRVALDSDVAAMLATYPSVTAPIVPAEFLGRASFAYTPARLEEPSGRLLENPRVCEARGSIEFTVAG